MDPEDEPMPSAGSGSDSYDDEDGASEELEWESGSDDGQSDQDEFEDQGWSSSDGDSEAEAEDEGLPEATLAQREAAIAAARASGELAHRAHLHMDDLSSDDEEAGNTIGNVPLRWYDEYDHIGYRVDGTKVMRRSQGDRLDAVLAARDDPNYDRTVYDALNDRNIVLTDRELEVLRRMQAGAFPHPEFDEHPDYVDFNTAERELMPLNAGREPKRRFVPSKWEAMKVAKIVKGIKEGRIRLGQAEEEDRRRRERAEAAYLMWGGDDSLVGKGDGVSRKHAPQHVPPPRMKLPGHAESYRPPDEFLLTAEEAAAEAEADPEERRYDFTPTKYNSLREVPAFGDFVQQRFDRCLDLYLCPRVLKRRLNIDPESLVPTLPKPRELRPYPTTLAVRYEGHTGRVRAIAVGPRGQFLASCSEDETVRLWEVATGRCVRVWRFGAPVVALAWNPTAQVLAAAFGRYVALLKTGTGSDDDKEVTEALLGSSGAEGEGEGVFRARALEEDGVVESAAGESAEEDEEDEESDGDESEAELPTADDVDQEAEAKLGRKQQVAWLPFRAAEHGVRMVLRHRAEVTCVAWHAKGDYLATTAPRASGAAVLVHQVSRRRSQAPFKKAKGLVQCVAFHPTKPVFFVATQRHVRVYHLARQMLVKRLQSGAKWISRIAVHRSGDHVVMGSYDRRVCWFDLDLSSTPFKTLKYHSRAVRDVALHDHHPLMATASDDGTVHIFHARVYNDLLTNPLLVPLKILRGHEVADGGVGVMGLAFHPTQPWVFSAGADGSVRLFQDFF